MTMYTKQDIANILQGLGAVEQAIEERDQKPDQYELGRRAGFKAALVSSGLCFGLQPILKYWRSVGPTWIEGRAND